jgi:broad specificity phosphatase PhoE
MEEPTNMDPSPGTVLHGHEHGAAPPPVPPPPPVAGAPSESNPFPQTWTGPQPSWATKSDKIVCVMVGLPARGKSYISRRLAQYLQFFYGVPTKVFNVGDYRRVEAQGATGDSYQDATFFDVRNEEAMRIRRKASELALADLTRWMLNVSPHRLEPAMDDLFLSGDFGCVAIFDATNSTQERRAWIVEQLRPTGAKIIFIESICNDEKRILENIMNSKVDTKATKDYRGVDVSTAVSDFQERIAKYAEVYETLTEKDLIWIKLIDGGREMSMNNIRGFLPSRIAQFLINLHVQQRTIYLSRHGQSEYNRLGKLGGDSDLTKHGHDYAIELGKWVEENVMVHPDGTPRPARMWTSSLLRTRQTAKHIPHPKIDGPNGQEWINMRLKSFRNLDEIYAGVCDGLTNEEVIEQFPEEAAQRAKDKFRYRYPRGESYTDLIARLEPIAHEIERLREPVVIIAHQAILRVLYAYFMGYPREQCIGVSVPLNTVIQLTPTSFGCEELRIRVLDRPEGEQLDPASH